MKTRSVPAIVMLTAGAVTCVVGIAQHFSFGTYVKTLFFVLVGFYLLGCIAKLVIDKGFHIMQDPLSAFEGLEMEEDLMDELAMADDEYADDYFDNRN